MHQLIWKFFKMGIRNVLANWQHSFASVLSICVCFTSLAVFEGYIRSVEDFFNIIFSKRAMLGDVIIESSRPDNILEVTDLVITPEEQSFIDRYIQNSKEIYNRVRFLKVVGTINNSSTTVVFSGLGYDPLEGAKMREPKWVWDVHFGKPIDQGDESSVVLGRELAFNLGCKPDSFPPPFGVALGFQPKERPFFCTQKTFRANVTTSKGKFNSKDFSPLGIIVTGMQEIDSKYLLVSLVSAQKLMRTKDVSFYTVSLAPKASIHRWISRFNAAVADAGHQLKAQRWQDHKFGDIYSKANDMLRTMRNLIVTIIFSIGFVSVHSALSKSVHERRKEIGTMRSMGFVRSQIVSIFAIEGMFLALIGSALGAVTTLISSLVINKLMLSYRASVITEPIPLWVSFYPSSYYFTAIVLCVLVVFAASFAAVKLVNKTIPKNLE